jgi:hypothetical protein
MCRHSIDAIKSQYVQAGLTSLTEKSLIVSSAIGEAQRLKEAFDAYHVVSTACGPISAFITVLSAY